MPLRVAVSKRTQLIATNGGSVATGTSGSRLGQTRDVLISEMANTHAKIATLEAEAEKLKVHDTATSMASARRARLRSAFADLCPRAPFSV